MSAVGARRRIAATESLGNAMPPEHKGPSVSARLPGTGFWRFRGGGNNSHSCNHDVKRQQIKHRVNQPKRTSKHIACGRYGVDMFLCIRQQAAMEPSSPLRLSTDMNDMVINFTLRAPGLRERSAFLVALAAFQRGLAVTFYRTAHGKTPRFQGALANGLGGAFFSVSDGEHVHFFSRTMGDKTSREASMLAEDKNLAKQALARAGIRTPRGMVARHGDTEVLARFLSSIAANRFVLKPVRGSLGMNTHVDISAAKVMTLFAALGSQDLLIEEYISGHEIRAYVVGDRCVRSTMLLSPCVVGNGVDSVIALMSEKATARANNLSVYKEPLVLSRAELAALETACNGLGSVLEEGRTVLLSRTKSVLRGADTMNADDIVNDSFREVAVKSCRALGLPNAALDIIVSDDPARPGAFVLEANQRAHVAFVVFPTLGPGSGNDIAEAIIDFYFPESCRNHLFASASFDFLKITEALQATQVDALQLPVLTSDWHHCRIEFADEAVSEQVWQILNLCGVYGRLLNVSDNKRVADVLLSPESQAALLPYRQHISALSEHAEDMLYGRTKMAADAQI